MHQLVYISAASPSTSDESLADILVSARRNNAKNDITGILLYHQGQFFQVLEGPEKKVRACFKRIEADPRHNGVIVLFDAPAEERCFHGWDMAAVAIDSFDQALRSKVIDLLSLREHEQYDELHANKIIGIFVDTYLSDLHRFARAVNL